MTETLITAGPLAHLRWTAAHRSSDRDIEGRKTRQATMVVLLHGIGGGRQSWADTVSNTGSSIADAGFDVVAPDLPGYGDSATVHPYSMANVADRVIALIEWLGTSACVLVGHSMGGMVAQDVVARRPDLVKGLVISASSPAFGKPDGGWQKNFLRERLHKLDDGQGMVGLAPALVRGMAAPHTAHAQLARATLIMASVPEATYRQALTALMGFDRRAQLSTLTMPVLCIAGELDKNAPPAVMQQMAERIPGCAYVCLPAVGHLANMEAPETFNPVVIEFLMHHFSTVTP